MWEGFNLPQNKQKDAFLDKGEDSVNTYFWKVFE